MGESIQGAIGAPAGHRAWRPGALAIVALTLLASGAAPAQAQRARRASPEAQAAIEQLGASDPSVVRGAIETLGVGGEPAAVTALVERTRRGLPPDLLDAALDALTVLGDAEAGPLLFELSSHRRAGVRLKAVQALVACRPRGADRVLAAALSDSDPAVRSAATEGLAELGAVSALDRLFLALEHDVPEAPDAIARLARAAEVERLLGYLGSRPLTQLRGALAAIVARADLPERARLGVIHRVAELSTPEVRAFLEELSTTLPEGTLRRAASDAASRIGS